MNFFQQLINTFKKGQQYDKLIEVKNKLAYELASREAKIIELEEQNVILQKENYLLHLLNKPPTETKKPSWLYGVMNYTPQRRIVSKFKDTHVKFDDPRDVFDKSAYLYRLMKDKGWLDGEKTLTQANKIHSWVVNQIRYEYDDYDNYRPVTETLIGKMGDCEDSGIVLCSAFGLAGWQEDEVFLAVGWYTKDNGERFYHAWCNVLIDGKWYVSEGTDPSKKLQPWTSSRIKNKYSIDGLWNWKFKGKLRKDKKDLDF